MSLDVFLEDPETGSELFWAKIAHNLGTMAEVAGFYRACWCPEEINITTARELAPHLRDGLIKLVENPKKYEQYNSPNGWGMYEHFVPWVFEYWRACCANPDALVRVSLNGRDLW